MVALDQLQPLTERIFWLPADSRTDRPMLGLVVGDRECLLIDAGNSPAHVGLLRQAIQAHGLPQPTRLAITHWHWDHVFGMATLDLPSYASQETDRILRVLATLDWSDAALDQRVEAGLEIAFCRDMIKAEMPERSQLQVVPATSTIAQQLSLDLGNCAAELIVVGGDHAHDSMIVFVPSQSVVFLGDCIYDDLYHGARRLTSSQLFPLLERLLALPAEYYCASHHGQPLTRAEFEAEAQLLRQIGTIVMQFGANPEAILAQMSQQFNGLLTDDHHAIMAAFLAGLALPEVASIY
ncbi:MBL fold metallo-hydrolase [Herpetosiphon giganteus]|uniref:MBL fold metallo-hydrolase n=1 Tax=Herpetosiphon giganteus TaxID=2029754 RepID=UPI001959A11A|nr:MBL fold metallo-hydrolase [Herpetosiphon giganteus]MBM7842038.1 glyoxylase-like metal-dependent hydrolase (beta-lactamase superfamily II) [Herpetosiphon giganteus]